MSTIESEAEAGSRVAVSKPSVKVKPQKKEESLVDKVLALLSSVRLGVTMLVILLLCCIVGMLVMQQDVQGFVTYYEKLTPSQKVIYGSLDFFNIYHSWYFALLLELTGLNIILASIDRFPAAWQYIRHPKLKASPNFIRAQMFSTEAETTGTAQQLAESIRSAWKKRGLRARISDENGRITVFGQRNSWNRIGAYFVHVALLTIFTGGFLTTHFGAGGMMELKPGETSSSFVSQKMVLNQSQTSKSTLPFEVECTDIQWKPVKVDGSLDANNTVDWLTFVNIKDNELKKQTPALVHLNEPFDYRGYRFFQTAFLPVGHARQITVSLVPAAGGPARDVTIARNSSTAVEGIGSVSFVDFFPDFTIEDGKPTTASPDYNNPVAQIRVTSPDGTARGAFAFNSSMADEFYSKTDDKGENPLLIGGYKAILSGFEKVPRSHTLAVQYDPGRRPVYAGFLMLVVALCSVFFFSHQRMWAVLEPADNKARVFFGGNTNRNRPAFEARFNSLVESAMGKKGNDHE